MRRFIAATCCTTALALMPVFAHSQIMPQATPTVFRSRPLPPTEPSVALPPGSTLVSSPLPPAPRLSGERPVPPTEPSVALPQPAVTSPPQAVPPPKKAATAKPAADAPRPVARQKTTRRPGRGPTGPVSLPPPDALVMMVRSALAGANQANFTDNYSVLHQLTTPTLQARLSAAKFGMAFADLRKQNLDLSPTLVLAPQFTETPVVAPNGALRLAGFFPTQPLRVNFDITYVPVDGFWSIDALSLAAVPASVALAATTGSATPVPAPARSPAIAVRMLSGSCIQQAKSFCRDVPSLKRLKKLATFQPV